MARYFVFNKLSAPGGLFTFDILCQNAEQLILNAIDQDFYPYVGQTLGWEAYGSGSTVTHNTSTYELEVVGACRLNGATEINLFDNGGWYKVSFDVFFTVGANHRIKVLNADGVQLFETALSLATQSFYFKAGNYSRGIIFFHSDTGGTRAFRLDNVSITPVVQTHRVKLSAINLGNDSDEDSLLYPGNCTLAIKLKEKLAYAIPFQAGELFLKDQLIDNNTYLTIKKFNGLTYDLFFVGILDAADMQYSEISGVFDFRFLDDFYTMKNSRAINHSGTYSKVLLSDYIASLVSSLGVGRTVVFKAKWEAYDDDDNIWRDTDEFYVNDIAFEFPYTDNPFSTKADVLKAILANLGAYGIAAPDNYFYVMPKFDNGEMEIETLYDDEMSEFKLFAYEKEEGFNFYEHNGEGVYVEPATVDQDYKDIFLPFPCSTVDEDGAQHSQTLFLTSALHSVSTGIVRFVPNLIAYDFKGCLEIIYSQTKAHLNKGIIVKPTGVSYPYHKFYEILKSRSKPERLIDTLFRPVNFRIDIEKNQTEISLIPAPPLVY